MYYNYRYIVKNLSFTASKASLGIPKSAAAASLILLNSSRDSSAPPAQTPVTPNSLGALQSNTNIPATEMGIMWPNPSHNAGNLSSSISNGKILTHCTVLKYQIHEDGIENSGTSFLHHQAEFLISHV